MCLKYYTNLGESALETLAMITQVLGEENMSHTWAFEWKSSKSPRLPKAIQVKSKFKSMIIIFFNINGIFNKEFILPDQKVNSIYYCDVLQ
jgi:hypothetical protein